MSCLGKELAMQAGGAVLIPYTYMKSRDSGTSNPNAGETETEENVGFAGQLSWSVRKFHVL